MTNPKPFNWSFDRNPWDSRTDAATFSVGVYQWLPKASGKGLKKSNTIRVLGYTADPNAVYEKAEELCRQLNKEKARFDAPPKWLQKQYSVPKPEGYMAPKQSDELNAADARKIRQRVMREHLLPLGFQHIHGSTYARLNGEIVQLINFQTSQWSGEFTVNLGLHCTFTPAVGEEPIRKWTDLKEYTCSLRGRIGCFMGRKLDKWWPFGSDPDALENIYIDCARQSVNVLEKYTPLLADPQNVSTNPPGLFSPFHRAEGPFFDASIEMRLGRFDAAEEHLRPMLSSEHKSHVAKANEMLQRLAELRNASGNEEQTKKLLRWLE